MITSSHAAGTAAPPTAGIHCESPQELVRSDTWWINCCRAVLMGTLVTAAGGTAWAIYKVASQWEYDSFRHEFAIVSERLSDSFLKGIFRQLWIARFALGALSQIDNFTDVNADHFADVFHGGSNIAYVRRMGYSPLLYSEQEKDAWEAHARKQLNANHTDDDKLCYICGVGNKVGSPDAMVNVLGAGSYSCELLENAGLQGIVPKGSCGILSGYCQPVCNCIPDPESNQKSNVTVADTIFWIDTNGSRVDASGPGLFCPIWKFQTVAPDSVLMYDQMASPPRAKAIRAMLNTSMPTFTEVAPAGTYEELLGDTGVEPGATSFTPVYDAADSIVGTVFISFLWSLILGNDLPVGSDDVVFVIENTRGQSMTYEVANGKASYVGQGDLHDRAFGSMMRESSYDGFRSLLLDAAKNPKNINDDNVVLYSIRIYPSKAYLGSFTTSRPAIYASAVIVIFVFTSITFLIYDRLVVRRQSKVMASAMITDAIVSTLFPESIRARLLDNNSGSQAADQRHALLHFAAPKSQLKTMLRRPSNFTSLTMHNSTEPIADFFPNVTVIFADIAGFTAWSSEREPAQVFQLLESLYHTFDKIAHKFGVFKVETVGDCYVAVTGLPEAQPDHVVRMARFAYEIMLHMHELVVALESQLGPGTGSLSIRIGLHSGPVTGGVLRGEKARFQLFGDTMNTAARMQSTGKVDMIHASSTTANLLFDAGEAAWLRTRDEPVYINGKGEMQTFWVTPTFADNARASSLAPPTVITETSAGDSRTWGDMRFDTALTMKSSLEDRFDRLVNWNTELLLQFLKKVVAVRNAAKRRRCRTNSLLRLGSDSSESIQPMDDVTDVIVMADFCEVTADNEKDASAIQINEAVRMQLHNYVERIAAMYRDNPFHNFEHASHVAMSASKIVKRIIKPEGVDYQRSALKKRHRKKAVAKEIHNITFGISSDALMQFAAIFSTVIHDVDHQGVSNAQLVKEQDNIAVKYANKCVAEQNSVQIAWELLMEEGYKDLQACIFSSESEKCRFRQLIVNAVIATDIADKELQTLRKNRWNKAFRDHDVQPHRADEDISCMATVVYEYIIQASDVAHTMQHWHIYSKWNEKLFEERYLAYLAGREEKDPSMGWYDGEIWFFDNYIIPLARKLETCGVFGVSSDEYLNYALENRHEWGRKGKSIVHGLVEKYKCHPVANTMCELVLESSAPAEETVDKVTEYALLPTAEQI